MECQNSLDEMFVVSVPVGASLESADFVVDSLDGSAGDGLKIPVEEPGAVGEQCLGHRLQDTNA